MMGIEFTGETPFSDVHITSIIQAPDGRRMSKSLGTGIDPLDLIEGGPRPPVFATARPPGVPGLRRRRRALGAAGHVLRSGRPLQRGQGRPGAAADQQALERRAVDPAGSRLRRRAPPATRRPSRIAGSSRAWSARGPRWTSGSSATTSPTPRRRCTTSSTASCATGISSWSSPGCAPATPSWPATLLHVLTETLTLAHPLIPFETEEIYSHIPGAEGLLAAPPGAADSAWTRAPSRRRQRDRGGPGVACVARRDRRAPRSHRAGAAGGHRLRRDRRAPGAPGPGVLGAGAGRGQPVAACPSRAARWRSCRSDDVDLEGAHSALSRGSVTTAVAGMVVGETVGPALVGVAWLGDQNPPRTGLDGGGGLRGGSPGYLWRSAGSGRPQNRPRPNRDVESDKTAGVFASLTGYSRSPCRNGRPKPAMCAVGHPADFPAGCSTPVAPSTSTLD